MCIYEWSVMSETAIITPDKPIVGLKREIGLLSASNFLINVIIGKLITTVVICYVKLSELILFELFI